MLSCRSRSIDGSIRSTPSYVRASLSAVRVISIMGSPSAENLPPLPIPDWSLALSMSFAYRQYRQSRLSMHKARAKEDLEKCCHLLDGLKVVWHSAGAMAEMGKAAIEKANQVCRATNGRISTSDSNTEKPKRQRRGSKDNMPSDIRRNSNNAESIEKSLSDPFPTESPTFIPGQHPISSTRGEVATTNASQPVASKDHASYDVTFDDIDAVLGSYPDLNFPMDFTDALASLDDANMHGASNNLSLGHQGFG